MSTLQCSPLAVFRCIFPHLTVRKISRRILAHSAKLTIAIHLAATPHFFAVEHFGRHRVSQTLVEFGRVLGACTDWNGVATGVVQKVSVDVSWAHGGDVVSCWVVLVVVVGCIGCVSRVS